MGVDISDIVHGKPCGLADFKGKAVAIDGYNTLYQFLSSIRQPDGTLLMDSKGRVTSHLSGTLQRTANLLEAGIKPVFVFDGKPNPLKMGTLSLRKERKEKAKEQWKEALERGDMETARIKAQQTSKLTKDMVAQAIELLGFMGVPCVEAPEEGEAQASHMALKGDVYAACSQDFDSLLFGTPVLIRNLTMAGRRKLPRRDVYVDVEPELLLLKDSLAALNISLEQLIDLCVLIGTDFNEGIKGIGPKKALKLVKEYGSGARAIKEKALDLPSFQAARDIFLKPNVTDNYNLRWTSMNREKIEEFLCGGFEFSKPRIQSTLDKISEGENTRAQSSLDKWF